MANHEFNDSELQAYLDEVLPVDEMSRIEEALRRHGELVNRLVEINRRRDAGIHSLAEIWQRHRLSCPSRQQLGSYLLDALDAKTSNYVLFHLSDIGCRYCQANLADLKQQQAEATLEIETRRRKFFQTSAGYLGG